MVLKKDCLVAISNLHHYKLNEPLAGPDINVHIKKYQA